MEHPLGILMTHKVGVGEDRGGEGKRKNRGDHLPGWPEQAQV
jgi:hypothetical protein